MKIHKKLRLIKNEKTLLFRFVGFINKEDYGEIFVTIDESSTVVYRGVGLKRVVKQAKNDITILTQ
jgi:hypothetical protein